MRGRILIAIACVGGLVAGFLLGTIRSGVRSARELAAAAVRERSLESRVEGMREAARAPQPPVAVTKEIAKLETAARPAPPPQSGLIDYSKLFSMFSDPEFRAALRGRELDATREKYFSVMSRMALSEDEAERLVAALADEKIALVGAASAAGGTREAMDSPQVAEAALARNEGIVDAIGPERAREFDALLEHEAGLDPARRQVRAFSYRIAFGRDPLTAEQQAGMVDIVAGHADPLERSELLHGLLTDRQYAAYQAMIEEAGLADRVEQRYHPPASLAGASSP